MGQSQPTTPCGLPCWLEKVDPQKQPARRKQKQFSQPISTSGSLLLSPCFHDLDFSLSLFHLKSHLFYSCHSPWLDLYLSVIPPSVSVSIWLEIRPMWGCVSAAPLPLYPGRCGGVCGRGGVGVGCHMLGALGRDPARNLLFLLSRPCLPVQPTSPAPSPWKRAADFLLVGGRGGGGEGRTGSPLLTPLF